jgi:hypothetical protein
MELRASLARVDQLLVDDVLGHVSNAGRGEYAISFHQKKDDQGAGFGV